MFVFLILFFSGNFLFAQNEITNEAVRYTVSFSNLAIGKPFPVRYDMPDDVGVILSIESNIIAEGDTDIQVSNLEAKGIDLWVTSFSPISYPMPSLLLTVLDTNGQTNRFYTPSFTIPISNKIIENTNISLMDIEQPYFVFNFLWLIVILGIVLLFVLYMFFAGRLSFKRSLKETKVPQDPFAQMRTRLAKLKKQRMELDDTHYKEFFVEISEAVREFLSETIVSSALETPTRDLLNELKTLSIPEEESEIIAFILRSTDRAKYAKQIFSEERIDQVLNESERLFAILFAKHQKEKSEKNHEL